MKAAYAEERSAHMFALLTLWAACALVSALIAPDIRHVQFRAGPRPRSEALLHRVFGSTRAAISHAMVLEADRYFHRGVPHQRPVTCTRFFSAWAERISPRSPGELRGGEIEEIMPWLRFATLSDPTNVEAYLTTAFWLSRQNQPGRVLHVFEEAERRNPDDYRVFMGKAFYFFENLLLDSSLAHYDKAMDLWPSTQDPHERQARLDRAQMLTFRGAIHELKGQYESAAAAYEEACAMFPDRVLLREQAERLRAGQTDRSNDFWRNVLQSPGITGAAPLPDRWEEHSHAPEAHPPGYCPACRTVH